MQPHEQPFDDDPTAPRRSGRLRNLLLAAAVLGAIALVVSWRPDLASLPDLPLRFTGPASRPPDWCVGGFMEAHGPVRLDLDEHFTGRLTLPSTRPGYLTALPVSDLQADQDQALFTVRRVRPSDTFPPTPAIETVQHYLLKREGDGTCRLYRLKPPPPEDPAATLIPTQLESHTLVARLVRPAAPDKPHPVTETAP